MIAEKLEEIERRFQEIETGMARPENISNQEDFRKLAREHAELREIVATLRELKKVKEELEKTRELLATHETDHELKEMAQEELLLLEKRREGLEALLKGMLLGKDTHEVKSMFL